MFGDKFLNRNQEDNAVEENFNLDSALDDITAEAGETAPAQEFVLDEPGADFDLSDFNFDETTPVEFEQGSNAGGPVDESISDLDDFKDLNLDDFSADAEIPVLETTPADGTETNEAKDDSLDDFQLPDLDENENVFSQDNDNQQDEPASEPVLQDEVNEPETAETEPVGMVSSEPTDSTGFWDAETEKQPAEDSSDFLDDFNFDQVEAAPVFDEDEVITGIESNEPDVAEANDDISAYSEGTYDEISATAEAPGFEDTKKTDESWEDNAEAISEGVVEPGESDSSNDIEAMEKILQNNLRWYSGSVNEPRFEISATSQSQDIVGSEECDIIHINVGMDTYGWNVLFENGVLMSLRDLRTYQSKFGQLPDAKGSILYGDLEVAFNQISKIVVYESAQYFSYGTPE